MTRNIKKPKPISSDDKYLEILLQKKKKKKKKNKDKKKKKRGYTGKKNGIFESI
jgi:hypothetical protein